MKEDWNLISTKECADILNVKQSTITSWIRNNRCPFPHIYLTSRIIRFKKTDVQAYLRKLEDEQ